METTANIVLLVLGVILLFFAIWLTPKLLKQKKSLTTVCVLFSIALVMIGFSTIQSGNLFGGVSFVKTAKAVAENPENEQAVAALDTELDKHIDLEKAIELQPDAKAGLSKAVESLSVKTNLSAEPRVTLSKAQFLLGRTNEAAATLHSAVLANPHLNSDPRIKLFMRRME